MLYFADNQHVINSLLFYQDFKDTFVCNTQPEKVAYVRVEVVLSGFQRYFCMQYTTLLGHTLPSTLLFYQDFKDTFVCNTQLVVPYLRY